MKRHLIYSAGFIILLASCTGSADNKDQGTVKAQIDSSVNARLSQKTAAIKAHNDSVIMAKADSLQKEQLLQSGNNKSTQTEAKTPPPPAPPANVPTTVEKPNPRPGGNK